MSEMAPPVDAPVPVAPAPDAAPQAESVPTQAAVGGQPTALEAPELQAEAPKGGVELYDISGQEAVLGTVPEHQVQEAISSGRFSFEAGKQIPVISPDGQRGTIPAEQAAEAFQSGYTYETAEMGKKAEYGSTGQQVIAGLEGAAQGLLGPIAPAIERAFGVNPEDIRGREEANPWTHGIAEAATFVGGALLGTGEAAVLAKAGEMAANALKLGGAAADATKAASAMQKIGELGVKGFVEMAAFQAGDEATKLILQDPHQSAQTALASIGISAALGATGGAVFGAVSPLWKATIGERLAPVMEDASNRLKYLTKLGGDEIGAVGGELEQVYKNIKDIHHGMWGGEGVRAKATTLGMDKVSQEAVHEQALKLSEELQAATKRMKEKGIDSSEFDDIANKYLSVLTDPKGATKEQLFNAMQDAKQEMGGIVKWFSEGRPDPRHVTDLARKHDNVVKSVRDSFTKATSDKIWGDVGKTVTEINTAAHELFTPSKTFMKAVMHEAADGSMVINYDKLAKIIVSAQKGAAKGDMVAADLLTYLEKAQNFASVFNSAKARIGMEGADIVIPSTLTKGALKELPVGAKAIDNFILHDAEDIVADVTAGAIGAGLSGGHHSLGAAAGKHVLSPMIKKVLPIAIGPFMENPRAVAALQASLDFSAAVAKADLTLRKATKSILKGSAEVLPKNFMPTEKDRTRISKAIEDKDSTTEKLLNAGTDMQTYLPAHATALAQTSARVVDYLDGQQPLLDKPQPFDSKPVASKAQEAAFNRTLDIAQQPMIVLQHLADGTLTPKDCRDVSIMYPELYRGMVNQLTEDVIAHTSKGESVPYKLRMSLSLFTATPMDTTMTPMGISAAQLVHASVAAEKAGQMAAGGKSMKSMEKNLSQSNMTKQQAAETRRAKV